MRTTLLSAVIHAGAVSLEATAAYALLNFVTTLFTGSRFLGPSILTTLGVISLAFLISKTVQHLDIDEADAERWAVGLSVFLFYTLMRLEYAHAVFWWDLSWLLQLLGSPGAAIAERPDAVIGVIGLAFCWGRGMAIGQGSLTFDTLLFPFSAGLALTTSVAIFTAAVGGRESLKALPVPFLLLGLWVLAVAHLARSEAGPGRRSGRLWTVLLMGTMGMLLGLSILVTLLDLGGVRELLAPVARLVLQGGHTLILLIAFATVYPVYWLLRGIVLVLSVIIPAGALDRLERLFGRRGEQRPFEIDLPEVPGSLLIVPRFLFLVVIAALAYLALRWLLRRLVHLRAAAEASQTASGEAGGLVADAQALMRALLGRFRRGPAPAGPALSDDIRSIQRLYLQMLRRAAEEGLSRPPAATPHEFAPPLVEHFGSPSPDEISTAFAAARYGRRPPSRQELERLRRAWQAVRKQER